MHVEKYEYRMPENRKAFSEGREEGREQGREEGALASATTGG